jgi:hypothetical protein
MNKFKIYFLTLAGFAIAPFLGVQKASALVKIGATDFPKVIDCGPSAQLLQFSLYSPPELEDLVKAQSFPLPFVGTFGLLFAQDSPLFGTRLDVCWNTADDSVTLQRIIKRIPTAGYAISFISDQIVPDQLKPNAELKKLLFAEPDANLELAFVNKSLPKKSYLLKSHGFLNGQAVVTLSNYDAKTRKLLIPPKDGNYPGVVRVGQLFHGNPWEVKPMTPVHRVFEVETQGEKIKISLDFAYRGQVGSYLSYKLNSAKIEDANGNSATGPMVNECTVYGSDPSPCWNTNLTHHGLQDTFVFSFENVSYTLGDHKIIIVRTLNNDVVKTIEIPVDNCDSLGFCGKEF